MSMINAFADEDDMIQHVRKMERRNAKRDMKMLIRELLEMPVSDGRVFGIDDVQSISELAKLNTDVRTRILISVANDAARGDIKAAELLLKYGGYTPAIEQNVSVRLPQIINDLTPPGDELLETDEVPGIAPSEEEEVVTRVVISSGASTPYDDDEEEGPPEEFKQMLRNKRAGRT